MQRSFAESYRLELPVDSDKEVIVHSTISESFEDGGNTVYLQTHVR